MIVRQSAHGVVVVEESGDLALYNEAAVHLSLVIEDQLQPVVAEHVMAVLHSGGDQRFEFIPPHDGRFLATARATAPQPVLSVRCLARYVELNGLRFVLVRRRRLRRTSESRRPGAISSQTSATS